MSHLQIMGRDAVFRGLASFVQQGLVDEDGRALAALGQLTGRLSELALIELSFTPQPSAKKESVQDAMALAYDAYVVAHSKNLVRLLAETPPALIGGMLSEEAQRDISKEHGFEMPELYPAPAADKVITAFEIARCSRIRALQRIAVLMYLHGEAKSGGSCYYTALEEEVETAREVLWQKVSACTLTLLQFAVVLGGTYLAEAKALVMNETFRESVGIMGYLQHDGRHPGWWANSEEEQFRAELAAYGNKAP